MLKKTLIVLFLLLSAIPALAVPMTCTCFDCATLPNETCRLPGGGNRLCSEYLKRCAPGLAASTPTTPTQEQFLTQLGSETAAATAADTAQSCR